MRETRPALELRTGTQRTFLSVLMSTLVVSVINFTVWFAVTFWVYQPPGSPPPIRRQRRRGRLSAGRLSETARPTSNLFSGHHLEQHSSGT